MASLESSNADWVARQLMNVCSQLCEQATISHPDFNEEGMMREGSEVRRATVDILVSVELIYSNGRLKEVVRI